MIILGLSDIHSDIMKLDHIKDSLVNADLVLLVGDITNFGREREATHVLESIMRYSSRVLAVAGNCDYPQVDLVLDKKGVNLHKSGVIINDIGFIGVGGSTATPFNTPNEMSEEDFTACLEKGLSDLPRDIPIILISHQPPVNTACDMLRSGVHVGSTAVRRFIEDHQPLICFTGHIHESGGTDTIGVTKIINPGLFRNGGYAFAEVTLDKDSKIEAYGIKRF